MGPVTVQGLHLPLSVPGPGGEGWRILSGQSGKGPLGTGLDLGAPLCGQEVRGTEQLGSQADW